MTANVLRHFICALALIAVAACRPSFQLGKFPTHEDLYRGALREYERGSWDNAVAGFDKLTIELPARDSLMPLSLFYLAKSHYARKEYLLAAQAYTRLSESFPNDTLADNGLYEAGRSYARLWKKPTLDAQYGETAISTLRTMQALYPSSPLMEAAQKEIDRLTQWLATKAYESGMFYLRRKAYDPAIIYFNDVVRLYPTSPRAREAGLRLVRAYRAINYREEASEACATLRQTYARDEEVTAACGRADAATTSPAPPAPTP